MKGLGTAAAAYVDTLWQTRSGRSRRSFERWQEARVSEWIRRDLREVAFYREAGSRLSDLPIVDKAVVMDRFEDFNVGRIDADEGWRMMERPDPRNDVAVGASTGTSGNRTLYAVTASERLRWLGTIVAKTVPDLVLRRDRIAVVLPRSSSLYDETNRTRAASLRFFDLGEGIDAWLGGVRRYDPTVVVAPPRVLRVLAEARSDLAPRRVFSGGETLDPTDRKVVERRFGLRLGEIYMASEGLFATTCPEGRLHLAEDANHFEFEPFGDGLSIPVVSSFRRRFQILARYRMNDLLRLSPSACRCGSPLRTVDEIVGRKDDAFVFDGADGRVVLTPDVQRNAVVDASRAVADFRIRRTGASSVDLVFAPELPDTDAEAARTALKALYLRNGIDPDVRVLREILAFDTGRKLRRVENLHRTGVPT